MCDEEQRSAHSAGVVALLERPVIDECCPIVCVAVVPPMTSPQGSLPTAAASPRMSKGDKRSEKFSFEPSALYFPKPYHNRSIKNTLVFYNKSASVAVFKLKALSPGNYIVRPKSSIAAPTTAVRFTITLKPTSLDISQLQNERFRISAKIVPSRIKDATDSAALWEACGPEVEMESNIPCLFCSQEDVPAEAAVTFGPADDGAVQPPRSGAAQSKPQQQSAPPPQKETPPPSEAAAKRITFDDARAQPASTELQKAKEVMNESQQKSVELTSQIDNQKKREAELNEKLSSTKQKIAEQEKTGVALHESLTKKDAKSSSGMLLSIVLCWMIIAYVAGLLTRQYLNSGAQIRVAPYLPAAIGEPLQAVLDMLDATRAAS